MNLSESQSDAKYVSRAGEQTLTGKIATPATNNLDDDLILSTKGFVVTSIQDAVDAAQTSNASTYASLLTNVSQTFAGKLLTPSTSGTDLSNVLTTKGYVESAFLQLSGGTLTGTLSGTQLQFSGSGLFDSLAVTNKVTSAETQLEDSRTTLITKSYVEDNYLALSGGSLGSLTVDGKVTTQATTLLDPAGTLTTLGFVENTFLKLSGGSLTGTLNAQVVNLARPSSYVDFGGSGDSLTLGAPTPGSGITDGNRVALFDGDRYALGVESGAAWISTGQAFKVYENDGIAITELLFLSKSLGLFVDTPASFVSTIQVNDTATFTSQIVVSSPWNALDGSSQILLDGLNGNRIEWNDQGLAPPVFGTRSAGTKLALKRDIDVARTDFAIGMDTNTMWFGVPEANGSYSFKFYGGETEVFSIYGDGTVVFTGSISTSNTLVSDDTVDINQFGLGDRAAYLNFSTYGSVNNGAQIVRNAGENGNWEFIQNGSGDLHWKFGSTQAMSLLNDGTFRLGDSTLTSGLLKINAYGTGDRTSSVQFAASDTGSYSASVSRDPGTDGDLVVKNTGVGRVVFLNSATELATIASTGRVQMNYGLDVFGTGNFMGNVTFFGDGGFDQGKDLSLWPSGASTLGILKFLDEVTAVGNPQSNYTLSPGTRIQLKLGAEIGLSSTAMWLKGTSTEIWDATPTKLASFNGDGLTVFSGSITVSGGVVNGLTLAAATSGFSIAGGTSSPATLVVTTSTTLNQNLRTTDSPSFNGVTLTGASASRLVSLDASKAVTTTTLTNWIAGTTNQVIVSDNLSGGVILAGPQNLHTGATPTFVSAIFTGSAPTVGGAAVVLNTRSVSTSGVLTGGGPLSSDLTLTVADVAQNSVIGRTLAGTGAPSAISTPMISVITAASNTAARTVLGLGSISTQDASFIAVTGGSLSGVTLNNLTLATGIPGVTVSDGTITLTVASSAYLNQNLRNTDSPSFVTVGLSGQTASRLVSLDASKNATSTNLSSWVTGTANRVTVTDNGSGGVTLSGPQDLATTSATTFSRVTVSGAPAAFFVGDRSSGSGNQGAFYRESDINRLYDSVGGDVLTYTSTAITLVKNTTASGSLTVTGSLLANGGIDTGTNHAVVGGIMTAGSQVRVLDTYAGLSSNFVRMDRYAGFSRLLDWDGTSYATILSYNRGTNTLTVPGLMADIGQNITIQNNGTSPGTAGTGFLVFNGIKYGPPQAGASKSAGTKLVLYDDGTSSYEIGVGVSSDIWLKTVTGGTIGFHAGATRVSYINSSGVYTGALNLTSQTASRLIQTDATKNAVSVTTLSSFIAGTANRVTVTDNGSGGVTLSGPQDLATTSSPTFANATISTNLTLSATTASRLLSTNANKVAASTNLSSWVTGTANRVTVTDNGSGGVTLSGPQDLATTSATTFSTVTVSGASATLWISDRTSSGQGAFYRSGGVNYLFDSVGGNMLSYTNTAISLGVPVTIYGGLTCRDINTQNYNITVGTGGIYLGGSASNNLLNDYEYGTFSPILASVSGGNHYTGSGLYTKIGNSVFVRIRVNGVITGTPSGAMGIGGLPFACVAANSVSCTIAARAGFATTIPNIGVINSGFGYTNNTSVTLAYGSSSVLATPLQGTSLAAGATVDIYVTATYTV